MPPNKSLDQHSLHATAGRGRPILVMISPDSIVRATTYVERFCNSHLHSPGSTSAMSFKATFFAALGYTQEEWRRLEADLRSQHLTKEAQPVVTSGYGQKY